MASFYGDENYADRPRRRTTADNPFAGSGDVYTPPTATPPTSPDAPPPSAPLSSPNYGSLTAGFDPAKLNDPNKHSFKYDFGRTVAPFDPRQGFTADVLKALNGLGYADFGSPGGDQLSIHGVTEKGRAAGMDPRDFTGDYIYAFDAQNDATKWGFDWLDDAYNTATKPPAATPKDPYGSLPSWLTDGLTADDLIRLSYNTYLGRDPESAAMGHSNFEMNDPRLLLTLNSIAKSAEAQQYAASHPGYAPPQMPTASAYGGSPAVAQALQRLALGLPQLMKNQQIPGAVPDPLTAWLLQLLGVG